MRKGRGNHPRFWQKVTRAVFPKLKLEDTTHPLSYLGKSCLAMPELDQDYEEIQIKEIVGSQAHPKHFQINGTHLVPMYAFYMQMLENRLPTEEEMKEFELATQIERITPTYAKSQKANKRPAPGE